jgi:hypothetical protein
MDIDEIVERWNSGEWPYRRLEDVVREHTGWSCQEYDDWAQSAVEVEPSHRVRAW